jgi:acyl dehydratase
MKYSELGYGQEAQFSHQITENDVLQFVKLTWDTNSVHTEPKMFDRPIVHGMLIASYISRMIGTILPGEGSVWNNEFITWHNPVFVGDTVTVRAWIIDLIDREKFVHLQTNVYNQIDELVIRGHGWIKMTE